MNLINEIPILLKCLKEKISEFGNFLSEYYAVIQTEKKSLIEPHKKLRNDFNIYAKS